MEDELKNICDWINVNKEFWLADIKKHFNVTDTPKSKNYTKFCSLIDELKRFDHIKCTEITDSKRKYVLIKEIDFKYVTTGKGHGYNPFKKQ